MSADEPMSTPDSGGLREAVEALHIRVSHPTIRSTPVCSTCWTGDGFAEWPCPTMQTLAAHPVTVPTPDSGGLRAEIRRMLDWGLGMVPSEDLERALASPDPVEPADAASDVCAWCHHPSSDKPPFDCRNPKHYGPLVIPATAKLRPGDLVRVIDHGWELVDADDLHAEVADLKEQVRYLQTELDADAKHAALAEGETCDVCTHLDSEQVQRWMAEDYAVVAERIRQVIEADRESHVDYGRTGFVWSLGWDAAIRYCLSVIAATVGERECRCAPCPGRGNDGHAMTHCAECCWGTGVEAEYGCPIHYPATPPADDANRVPVSGGLDESEREALDAEAQVWALADELCTTWHDNDGEHEGETPGLSGWLVSRWACQDCYDTACTMVDTVWLKAERDTARREAGERIAQAIEAERDKWDARFPVPEGWDLDYIMRRHGTYSGLDRAARMARADALTSDDGSGV